MIVISKKYGNKCPCKCCNSTSQASNSPITTTQQDNEKDIEQLQNNHYTNDKRKSSAIKALLSNFKIDLPNKYRFSINSWINVNPNLSLTSAKVHAIKCKKLFNNFFDNTLYNFISKFPKILLVIFQIIGYLSIIGVFIYPKLDLPDTAYVQLFRKSFPMEAYEKDLKYKFNYIRNNLENSKNTFTVYIIIGILPKDNGDHFNPVDRGFLELDYNFNYSNINIRKSIKIFCNQLRNHFNFKNFLKEKKCFNEIVEEILALNCNQTSNYQCCQRYEPFTDNDLHYCYPKIIQVIK